MRPSPAGRKRFLEELFAALWRRYRAAVPYARVYEEAVLSRGGAFRNDHVAFRTIASTRPDSGLASVALPFEALGYSAAGTYRFPEQKLSAIHLAPPSADLPKVFVSELRAWELSPRGRRLAFAAAARARPSLNDSDLAALFAAAALTPERRRALLRRLLRHFDRPWPAPARADVLALERESQYAAWVLVHGRRVNHFTAAVDARAPGGFRGLEEAAAALKAAGVPMKPAIEGRPGSPLRQTSTLAVVRPAEMRVGRRSVAAPWTYAYFELAERPRVGGRLFEGFLGGQASRLFEMTRRA
jgi:hypothetical protein